MIRISGRCNVATTSLQRCCPMLVRGTRLLQRCYNVNATFVCNVVTTSLFYVVAPFICNQKITLVQRQGATLLQRCCNVVVLAGNRRILNYINHGRLHFQKGWTDPTAKSVTIPPKEKDVKYAVICRASIGDIFLHPCSVHYKYTFHYENEQYKDFGEKLCLEMMRRERIFNNNIAGKNIRYVWMKYHNTLLESMKDIEKYKLELQLDSNIR